MGPSGSGKTSLLNALAGQVAATKGMHLSGGVFVNGLLASSSNHRQAYVQQVDRSYELPHFHTDQTFQVISHLPNLLGCIHTSQTYGLYSYLPNLLGCIHTSQTYWVVFIRVFCLVRLEWVGHRQLTEHLFIYLRLICDYLPPVYPTLIGGPLLFNADSS